MTLTYDLNGNRATRVVTGGADNGTDTYSYDFENRLIGLVKGTSGGAGTYAYSYDYRTRRIVRDETSASGTITKISFSGGTSVQEYDGGTPTLSVEYIRGSDYGGGVGGILYTIRSGVPSYTHEDKRGDVVAKVSATGTLTYQAQYAAFGSQTATNGSTSDRQKSNSKDTDPTNLVDEGFRYRDLETGMFISRDSAGFVDGPNLYTYVVQNPWTNFDPEGLATEAQYDQQIQEIQKQENQATLQSNRNGGSYQDAKDIQAPYEAAKQAIKEKKEAIEETAKQINDAAGKEIVNAANLDDISDFYKGLQSINFKLDALEVLEDGIKLISPQRKAEIAGEVVEQVGEDFVQKFASDESAVLEPYGGPGGGHHVPAKKAFEGDPAYDKNAAPAISNDELERMGVSHTAMTGAQKNALYCLCEKRPKANLGSGAKNRNAGFDKRRNESRSSRSDRE